MPLRAKRLKNLRMDEVSGVDAPAHLSPGYLVMKALAGGDPLADLDDEQIEELTKALMGDEQGDHVPNELIDSLTKAMDAMPDAAKAQAAGLIAALGGGTGDVDDPVAKAVAEALTKANADREAAEAKATAMEAELAKAKGGQADSEEVALAKAMESWPEPVRKAWSEQQERVAKAEEKANKAAEDAHTEREARVSAEYLAKAKGSEYSGLAIGPEALATALREIDEKVSKEAGAELTRVLKAAAHTVSNPGQFNTYGGAGEDVTDQSANGELLRKAKELQTNDPKLTQAEAITKAADLIGHNVKEV